MMGEEEEEKIIFFAYYELSKSLQNIVMSYKLIANIASNYYFKST